MLWPAPKTLSLYLSSVSMVLFGGNYIWCYTTCVCIWTLFLLREMKWNWKKRVKWFLGEKHHKYLSYESKFNTLKFDIDVRCTVKSPNYQCVCPKDWNVSNECQQSYTLNNFCQFFLNGSHWKCVWKLALWILYDIERNCTRSYLLGGGGR